MKKLGLILGIVLALIVVALIVIPLFFKSQILDLVKREANKNLNATLDFEDLDLSLIRSFPDLSLRLEKLSLVNHAPFAGDTLLSMASFGTTVDLMSLIRGNTVSIIDITLDRPRIRMLVLEDGSANWEISKASASTPADTAAPAALNLALRQYEIKNCFFQYEDRSSGMMIVADGLDHRGSGDFTQEQFRLRTTTAIRELTAGSGAVNYLNRTNFQLKADLDVDHLDQKITLRENELRLNALSLAFDGWIAMLENETQLDLTFKTNTAEFKDVLSLIPAIYTRDFAQLRSSGQMSVQGFVKGSYRENLLPAFELQLAVQNGMFQYPSLPKSARNVAVDFIATNPGGEADATVLNLRKLHVDIDQDPFDATLVVKTPVSDPHLNAKVKGRIDLKAVKELVPQEPGVELAGVISADFSLAGNMSSLEKQRYDKFQARGDLAFRELRYRSPALPQEFRLKQADLSVIPERVALTNFSAQLGESDLQAEGTLQNFLPYVLGDQNLQGTLSVNSRFFDLNPWMEGESEGLKAVELPDNIEFVLNSSFQVVQYGKLKLERVTGMLVLKERALHLMNLNMNLLGGSLLANGSYSTPPDHLPRSTFDLEIKNFGIRESFDSFLTVQKFMPLANSMSGDFGAKIQLATDLDSTLTPVFGNLSSRGTLAIEKAVVQDFKPLNVAADLLKMDQLKSLVVEKIKPAYSIRDGRLHLSPVDFKFDDIGFVVSGSNGLDKSMDYVMKMAIPAKKMSTQANAAINQVFNKKLDLVQDDSVVLDLLIGGTADKPEVKVQPQDIVKGAAAQVASVAQQQLESQKAAIADSANAELEKQKQELERMQKEAEAKAKEESKKLEEEAKKKLKKLFKP